jgi:hypothetical protein
MITGEFTNFAVSKTAFMVLVLITFTAGKAKSLLFASSNNSVTSSPNNTPGRNLVFAFKDINEILKINSDSPLTK